MLSCAGIEHEDIGGSGTAASGEDEGMTSVGETGGGDGDGDGEEGSPKLDVAGDDTSGGEEPTGPRLFVAVGAEVKMFMALDEIDADVPPDGELSGVVGTGLGLAIGADRLFVAGTDPQSPMFAFDDADSLVDGDGATVTVPVAGFEDNALGAVAHMEVDAQSNLWIVDGDVRLFTDVGNLDGNAMQRARFTGGGLVSSAHDASGSKLIAADPGGADLPVFPMPLMANGDAASGFDLANAGDPRSLVIGADRLYAVGPDPLIRIWADIDAIAAPAAPNVVVSAPNDDLSAPSHVFLRDNVLVVCDDSGGTDRVAIYADAAGLQSDSAADQVITDAALVDPREAILDSKDTLYVRTAEGVLIFDDATTSPVLRAELSSQLADPSDMALLECSQTVPCGQGSCVSGLCQP